MRFGTEGNFESGENEEESKNNRHPEDLHQYGSKSNKESSENQRTKNSIKENAVTETIWYRKEIKDNQKDKEIVDREAFLHEIAGEELQTALSGKLMRIISGKTGILRKDPKAPCIKSRAECERQTDPDNDVENSIAVRKDMLPASASPHVQKQSPKNQQAKKGVEPPILGEGKELRVER